MLGIKQEWDRLREAMRRKDQETRTVEYATVRDVSPWSQHGFIVAEKEDHTPINVLAWTGWELTAGMQVVVARISRRVIDWYVLVSVNAETGGTPDAPGFAVPTIPAAGLPAHDLAGAQHAGSLPWGRVDLSLGKPDLGSDVVGVLARGMQEAQVRKEVYQATIPAAAEETVEVDLAGARLGLVCRLALTGAEPATLVIRDAPAGSVAYQTAAAIGLPYLDVGSPWYWEDASGEGVFRVELTNDGDASAEFGLTLTVLAIGGAGN